MGNNELQAKILRLEQENEELSKLIRGTKDYAEVCSVCKDEVTIYPNISGRTDYTQNEVECRTLAQIITRKNNLEQENKELSFAIEKCLENAGIECDDEEQALRSLPMLGNAHYKVLVEKEELEQENKELKEKITSLESEIRQKKMTIMMNNDHYLTVDENNRNYRSALEEIKKLTVIGVNASQCNCGLRALADDILNKINEVLNDK